MGYFVKLDTSNEGIEDNGISIIYKKFSGNVIKLSILNIFETSTPWKLLFEFDTPHEIDGTFLKRAVQSTSTVPSLRITMTTSPPRINPNSVRTTVTVNVYTLLSATIGVLWSSRGAGEVISVQYGGVSDFAKLRLSPRRQAVRQPNYTRLNVVYMVLQSPARPSRGLRKLSSQWCRGNSGRWSWWNNCWRVHQTRLCEWVFVSKSELSSLHYSFHSRGKILISVILSHLLHAVHITVISSAAPGRALCVKTSHKHSLGLSDGG